MEIGGQYAGNVERPAPDALPSPARPAPARVAPRRRPTPAPAWHIELAEMVADGVPMTTAAQRLRRARSAVYAATQRGGWGRLLDAAAARHRAAADRELARLRPAAVRALGVIIEAAVTRPESVDAGEVRAAAASLLAASQPPSERQRAQARADLLRALPVALRRSVVAALDEGDRAYLAALSDDELDLLIESGRR